jgi:multidrug resistance efflux pump
MKWLIFVVLSGSVAAFVASKQLTATYTSSDVVADANVPIVQIAGIGYIEPVTEVRKLGFKTSGLITINNVEVGSTVTRGQVLMVLDKEVLLAEMATAQANLRLAEARRSKVLSGIHREAIRAAKQRLAAWNTKQQYWSRELERGLKLRGGKAITEAEIDEKRTNLGSAAAEAAAADAHLTELQTHVRDEDRDLADAEVAHAKAGLELVCQRLKETELLSPIDGTILEVLKREGEVVSDTMPDAVLLVADCSRLRVRAEIDERHVPELRVGLPVRVYGRNLGSRTINGQITQIKQVMGEKTVFTRAASERRDLDVVQVFVDVPQGEALPVGLRVDVAIAMN